MERIHVQLRPDKAAKLESIGLSFHDWDQYWKEDVAYRFTLAQVDHLEEVTEELHQLCLQAVDHVIEHGRLGELGIPPAFHAAIAHSWQAGDASLYGRFDLAYDGHGPAKMLEYNADTPTSLLESAVAQWYWMEDVFPGADQFNSLHDKLVQRWQAIAAPGSRLHVASIKDNEEDWVCAQYLVETALQAGLQAQRLDVESIGWDSVAEVFVDEEEQPIELLFKLYPWEWMMTEDFGAQLADALMAGRIRCVEPIWKSVLSCKAILAILWQLNPGHPNLLEAHFEPGTMSAYAKKPFYSREGANVALYRDGIVATQSAGPYGTEGYVYQALAEMPCLHGRYPVIGSWVVGNSAAGMCVREDDSPVTTNMSNFVPHFFDQEHIDPYNAKDHTP